jgi:hypothetical protein
MNAAEHLDEDNPSPSRIGAPLLEDAELTQRYSVPLVSAQYLHFILFNDVSSATHVIGL